MSSNNPRPQIPQDMKAFNEKLIAEFRDTGGRLSGSMQGRQLLLLTTKGARSGAPRTTVVGYRPNGDGYAVIASNNGAPKAPAWFHNLMADPSATVEVGPEKLQVTARVASGAERAELAKRIEYLGGQQAKTEREIPIVLLERL
jgi:deazaflavin-dependent oxidoreductase (nitroreductase family)